MHALGALVVNSLRGNYQRLDQQASEGGVGLDLSLEIARSVRARAVPLCVNSQWSTVMWRGRELTRGGGAWRHAGLELRHRGLCAHQEDGQHPRADALKDGQPG
jgi:hypothetical protein